MGPHPYPWMVREFHRVIGDEAREQCRDLLRCDPDVVVACVGGGSNAIGIFSGSSTPTPELVGVEPAGGAAVSRGIPGVVHGMKSYLMQDEYGQVRRPTRSRPGSTTRASARALVPGVDRSGRVPDR
jgi:tryptophan synthase beta chain